MDTPMIRQYKEIKAKYKDYIIFFRLGDFYEMFFEDAEIGSKELEITLTSRDPENKVPMAGVPYHAADQYIARLVSRGYKVVICEQMEDPKLAKDLVKRDVVKIITPGTITDMNALEDKKNNFLSCIFKSGDSFGLSFADLLTGEFLITELISSHPYQEVINEIAKFQPRECIINGEAYKSEFFRKKLEEDLNVFVTLKNDDYFDENDSRELLISQFHEEKLESILGKQFAFRASGACLKYLNETQKLSLIHINSFKFYESNNFMVLDVSCRRNLELTESLKDGRKTGTLLWVLDNTLTSMGGRLLRNWIEQPLLDIVKIQERQDAVEELLGNYFLREDLKEQLKNIYDIERLTGKLVCGNCNARDFIAIKNTIQKFPQIKKILSECKSKLMIHLYNQMDNLEDIYVLLDKSIDDDPPMTIKEGGIIKEGYDPEIDKLRRAAHEGKTWIADLERKEKDRTGIKSLKVGFNKVFGYYIEVTKSNLSMVPENYIRKQTLAGGERYITEELKEYETLILNAEERLQGMEYEAFCRIRDELIKQIPRLKKSAYCVSVVDSLLSLAEASAKNNYVKPEITLKDEIHIEEGRHPVVEKSQKGELFIPNDTHINCSDSMISVITGPNMAGKSTYMRQVALIVLMAQIGCFVPAKRAEIGLVDRIFTRIGASDNLASGQSTFMVEMSEMAYILKNATAKSLLILDEVGRGTSTFDGLSIAWAVIEYIRKNIKAKTLFATHYHELTALKNMAGIKNYKITVKERGEDIIFLRKIIAGEADKSYGIQVAKLAGLPNAVVRRARELLTGMEKKRDEEMGLTAAASAVSVRRDPESDNQISLDSLKERDILDTIKSLDINTITPLEALNLLYSLKQRLQ
jgi:DNA mismatch repair protein MutS